MFNGLALAQNFPVKNYTIADGLPHTQVTDIFQDSKGKMWFSTPAGGISCFDGNEFHNYGTSKGLTNLVTRACTEDHTGRIIIGTMGSGLFFLDNDTVTPYVNENLNKEIFCLFTDKKGKVWIGTSKGLFTLQGNTLVDFTKANNLPAYAVTNVNQDVDGNIWFLYDSEYGLYKYDGRGLVKFDAGNGLINGRLLSTFHDAQGITWVAAFDGIYTILPAATKAVKLRVKGLPEYYPFGFIQLSKDLFFICSQDKGITAFNRSTNAVSYINSKNGLKSDLVFRLFKDAENNVWFSNWGEGISRLYLSGFDQYAENSGLTDRIVNSVLVVDGKMLASTKSGIVEFSNGLWTSYAGIKKPVYCLYADERFVWCAAEKELYQIEKSNKKVIKHEVASVKGMTKTGNGKMMFASWGGGLFEYSYDTRKIIPVNDSLTQGAYYYCAYTDKNGNAWFGTFSSGIFYYNVKHQTFKHIGTADGLPSDIITSIVQDHSGNIWAGTSGAGIAVIDPLFKVIKVLTENNGLKANAVTALAVDATNSVWIGQVGNVGCVSSLGKQGFEVRNFGKHEGFIGDCLYNGMVVDNKGVVWIATNNYLWTYDKQKQIAKKPGYHVYLSSVLCDFKPVKDFASVPSMNFNYDENRITFKFYSTHIYRNDLIQYKYRLVGLETSYSPPTRQSEVTFYDLHPGDYTFEVLACIGNNCSQKPAQWKFVIYPPFWQTWWFRITVLVVLVVLIWFIFRWRTAQLRRNQLLLEKQVHERTLEIKKQRDEIHEQKEMLEEKQKEIIDSIRYAKRIQESLLPSTKSIDRAIKRLKNDSANSKRDGW